MKYPLKTSDGWTWYLFVPEVGWPEEHMDLHKQVFDKLTGGNRKVHSNDLTTHTYSTKTEADQALACAKAPRTPGG